MPRKRRRPTYRKPHLTVAQILAWADDYKRRIGRWPTHSSGRIRWFDATWLGIDASLRHGHRGLPGGSSLANLLFVHRGVRNPGNVPALTTKDIVRWARAHLARTGSGPSEGSGAVADVPGESWSAIDQALRRGTRGLPGRSSLAKLLAAAGVKQHLKRQPRLTTKQVLAWADAYFHRHGEWPASKSGRIAEDPFETWMGIDRSLRFGRRGLPGGLSLPKFLDMHRDLFRGKSRRPKKIRDSERLNVADILAWGKQHFQRTGRWPNRDSGRVRGRRGQKWSAIDAALKAGNRGLPGGSSLAKLFAAKQ